MTTMNQETLLSHAVSPESLENTIQKITARIKQQGDKPYATVQQQLELVSALSQFDFGCYLLQNQGINGYWTHYMLTHPWVGRKTGKNNRGEALTSLEDFVLNRSPTMLATQERFEIFLRENQKAVKNNAKLACIPSGMMGELLYLDYENINKIELIGVDYDLHTFKDAEHLAEQRGLQNCIQLIQKDAWHLGYENEFDLISSNGLNIYESSDDKVTELYRQFYHALKPGGKLVTSFLTYPPNVTDHCEWDMTAINPSDLMLQKILFLDVLDSQFRYYRTSEQTKAQLESLGFKGIEFIYDRARIFPTVLAYK